jgi:hypothetical protein
LLVSTHNAETEKMARQEAEQRAERFQKLQVLGIDPDKI